MSRNTLPVENSNFRAIALARMPRQVPQKTTGPITEGSATILPISNNTVFYNPAQVFNRDLSVLLLSVYARTLVNEMEESPKLRVLEGLAASGLRSVRYAKEVKGIAAITANDLDATAVENIRKNFEHNGLKLEISDHLPRMAVTHSDAIKLMRDRTGELDVIDLDPYGSAAPFLDAAVSSVKSGGLLAVTSTDSIVLNGNNTGTCFLRYGGVAVKAPYGHELALRLLLGAIQSAAARHRRSMKVLAAFSIDFYYRVFVQISDDPQGANEAVLNTGLVFQCTQCEAHAVIPLGRRDPKASDSAKPGRLPENCSGTCQECGGAISMGGPFFSGAIYDAEFVNQAMNTVLDRDFEFPFISSWDKIKALLHGLAEELVDVPLFFHLPSVTNSVKLPKNIKLNVFRQQLKFLGYRVSGSHREPACIKTDAPSSVVYAIVRSFAQTLNFTGVTELAKTILAKPVSSDLVSSLDFSRADPGASRPVGVYLPNPERNWGPKPAAKRRKADDADPAGI